MAERFDAYHKWLGIPAKDQPPNHYRLLGIELFESDADVINFAADQRMSLVRSMQSGKHSQLTQQLLNELSSARVCLLNAKSKAAYDAQLQTTRVPDGPLPMGVALAPELEVSPQLATPVSVAPTRVEPIRPTSLPMGTAMPPPAPPISVAEATPYVAEHPTHSRPRRRRRDDPIRWLIPLVVVGVILLVIFLALLQTQ